MMAKAAGGVGISAIVAGLGYVFSLLSSPDYLLALLVAVQTHQDPDNTIIKLFAALIALVGAVTCTCVGFWLAHSPLATFSVTTQETTTTQVKEP
jgi:hypothetical protein